MDDIDFLASENWLDQGAMHERMRWLRENAPVYWSEKTQVWVCSRFEEVSYVSKNNQIFCSGHGVLANNPAKLGLIDEDEPRHTQLRRLINKGFTPRMVKNLESVFRDISTEALDAVADKGECDFVDDIAVPLPLLLIAEMIGIRREDRHRFHEWSDAMILAQGRMDDPVVVTAAGKAFGEYAAYCTEIIEDRRRNPRDDLMSILVGAKEDGTLVEHEGYGSKALHRNEEEAELANDELIKMCVLLLVAGNETTRNALSGGMQLLIENPEARQQLIDDPTLIPTAVEEMLRLVSPVLSFSRTATQDTELGGHSIKEGQKVLMLYPSANRDATQFDDPESFRIERNPHHLAFGIGNHFCLGANLARMEMRVAFEEILRRIPDMQFSDGGPSFAPSALVRSCEHMRVQFTPEN